jgi:DNA-binding CsgD family transcriptional regulator
MDRNAYDSLTPMERNCLRLAHHDRKTEQIAHELGIAASTVNTHIFAARRKLGGPSRLKAGDQLRAFEAGLAASAKEEQESTHTMSRTGAMEPGPGSPPQRQSSTPTWMAAEATPRSIPITPTEVREERAVFVFDDAALNPGGPDRQAASLQRAMQILAIALLFALVLIAAPAIYDSTAQRIANSLERPHPR